MEDINKRWKTINISVPGVPKSQKRHRFGRGFTYDPSKKDKSDFLSVIRKKAPIQPFLGSVALSLVFTMPRPKNHFKTGKNSHLLKEGVPFYHIKKPDIDNLIKFVMDALGRDIFFKDDSLVCIVDAVKVYGPTPQTDIMIGEMINDKKK